MQNGTIYIIYLYKLYNYIIISSGSESIMHYTSRTTTYERRNTYVLIMCTIEYFVIIK